MAKPEQTVSDPAPPPSTAGQGHPFLTREWLVTNGLGGYASGTACGLATRRYHGLLVSALPAPLGRMMMLDELAERIGLPDGTTIPIGVEAVSKSGAPGASKMKKESAKI